MMDVKAVLFISLAVIAPQTIWGQDKPEFEFPLKDFFPKNQFGIYMIKLWREVILGEKKSSSNADLEKQLKLYSTVSVIDTLTREISENTENLHELTLLVTTLHDLSLLFDKIDDAYELFIQYKSSQLDASDPSVHEFLKATRNPYQGPTDYISSIYSSVVPKNVDLSSTGVVYLNDGSVLSLISKHNGSFKRLCNKHKSQQQILQMLYASVSVADMKVYATMEYVHKELSIFGESNYEKEMKALNEKFFNRATNAAKMFQHFMSSASREVMRCDPAEHVEDKTYSKLYDVFQKYVINDEELARPFNCYKRCSSVTKGSASHCANKEDNYNPIFGYVQQSICDQQRKCDGDLFACEDYFESSDELWICPSKLDSSRRYEFMEHGHYTAITQSLDVKHYGLKGDRDSCERQMSYDIREFGQSWDDIARHCEICLCTCHDWKSKNSDRFLNFRPAVADNDYVVTSVRLVKQDHTLNLQIEQGKIHEDGLIDQDTVHWKPIATARSIYDLRSISWENFNEVYLGVTEVPKGRVVVGLKLSNLKTSYATMLGIKTLSVPYDVTTGKLTYNTAYYIEPKGKADIYEPEFDVLPDLQQNPLPAESKVNLDNCDVPINTEIPSVPQPESKKYLKFTTSDFKKDLGQNLIPYLDIQDVLVRPAVPLSGVSFYHKNRENYGGFLGIKLHTFDMSPYIN